MRLSISNIAWAPEAEDAIAGLLGELGIDAVDVAPGRYFPDPEAAGDAEITRVRDWWAGRGLEVVGLQALLFGTTGLNLFGDDGAMLRRLGAVCRIAGGLGARALTFGSPRQRDRSGLEDAAALQEAVRFFRRVGERAAEAGVLFCLEPNPAAYGCNFMTGTEETAAVVARVDHPNVRLQLDVGAMAMNGEDPAVVIPRVAPLIGHVHASEPQLATLGDAGAPHAAAGAALAAVRPDLTVTIEMRAAETEPQAAAVRRAMGVARLAYGDEP